MKLRHILTVISFYTILTAFFLVTPVSAHDQPDGDNWIMADWMLWSFMAFFGAGLIVLLVAIKRGLLSNLEDAKYYILSIDEQDFYTPEWAKDEDEHRSDPDQNDDQDPPRSSPRRPEGIKIYPEVVIDDSEW